MFNIADVDAGHSHGAADTVVAHRRHSLDGTAERPSSHNVVVEGTAVEGAPGEGRASVPLPSIREWQGDAPRRHREAAATRQPRATQAAAAGAGAGAGGLGDADDRGNDTSSALVLPSLKPAIRAS